MLDLAKHIVQQKAAEFDPDKFEDRYESALVDLVNRKRNGERITPISKPCAGSNVVDLMTALRRSLDKDEAAKPARPAAKKKSKTAAGQREMLLPISGKGAAKATDPKKAEKPTRAPARSRKAG
jgi:DNA end-binding protein Ku